MFFFIQVVVKNIKNITTTKSKSDESDESEEEEEEDGDHSSHAAENDVVSLTKDFPCVGLLYNSDMLMGGVRLSTYRSTKSDWRVEDTCRAPPQMQDRLDDLGCYPTWGKVSCVFYSCLSLCVCPKNNCFIAVLSLP